MSLDLTTFAIKWQQTQLTERSAYQQHFRDLCEALGVPHPTEEDLDGSRYTFEKRVTKVTGTKGFVDVWKRDAFAFEYKLPGGDLRKAYAQVIEYHEDLGNPPLLVVSDFKTFEVHTKFDTQRSRVYKFDLEELRLNKPVPTSALLPQDVLRYVFGDRNKLRPEAVTERVTRDAASDLLKLAQQLELESAANPSPHSREQIANFLIRIVFCLFADSIGLIPNNVFRKLVEASLQSRIMFNRQLPQLFQAMSSDGVYFGADIIPWFNGGLFNGSETIELNSEDCAILRRAARHDWSQIEPSIFGTLFERSLDAAKRSMIGAHYTSPEDILLLVEPVVMEPLRRQWASTLAAIEDALAAEDGQTQRRNLRANRPANRLLTDWAACLQQVRILDPACGSGNFLYIAMKELLELWEIARAWGLERGLVLPVESMPTPAQLYGIELDFYAHEIASAVVWIGLLQWKRDHSYNDQPKPVLQKLDNIQHADAVLRYDGDGKPYEPDWPRADYIIGNPPFLGGKLLRRELGNSYVDALYALYAGRVEHSADLVLYWFEKSRAMVQANEVQRVGLIGTQAIRGGLNRRTLDRIAESGSIFYAWSDRDWTLAGATVHVSMVAFDGGQETSRTLNGIAVERINPNLTTDTNVTVSEELAENRNLCFQGNIKSGPFDVSPEIATKLLRAPTNPNGRPNSDVLQPWVNASDVTGRPRGMMIINFGERTEKDSALYELPFDYVERHVRPKREKTAGSKEAKEWWLHHRSRPAFWKRIGEQTRYICTPRHSKHRFFLWLTSNVVPDSALVVVARSDDYMFGVLSASAHEIWARSQGTQVRDVESGFRYTPESCFDTFPFPWPPGTEPSEADSPTVLAIARAARELVRLRDAWINPPEASDDDLKSRTLTKLYNARPEWLANAHRTLDEAVFSAYGWPSDLTDQELLSRLLALNHERAALQSKPKS